MSTRAASRRVLVTGGAGFVGSHLCERLLRDGAAVTCLDNFVTGTRDNVAPLLAHPRFSVVDHDVTAHIDLEPRFDEVFNLACPASPIHYQRDPIYTTRTSVEGTLHALELATRHGARMVQASTSEVYGDPVQHPQREAYWGHVNPLGPRACYDEGKRCAESLCMDHRRHRGTRVKIARIFNTYGPRMDPDDGRVVSNFVVQALRGEPITLYGDGSQTRAFCYVDDLVDGLVRLMAMHDAFAGPVNLGNPHEITVRTLAERVIALTRTHVPLIIAPLPQDDPVRRCPDITLARTALHWMPQTDLETGLKHTIAHFARTLAQRRTPPNGTSVAVGAAS